MASPAGKHVYTGEDRITNQHVRVYAVRMCPYADASLRRTEALKETAARIDGERELRMPDVLNIGQLDDGTCNALVERAGLDVWTDLETSRRCLHLPRCTPVIGEQVAEDGLVNNREAGLK